MAAICLSAVASAPSDEALRSVLYATEGRLEWHFKGKKLLTYAYASSQFKPYIRELLSLSGENVLLDAPHDHLHHHGLMYAIRINGVNFWEEVNQPGHQRHLRFDALEGGAFTESIHWVEEVDAQAKDTASRAFLIERRTLRLAINEPADEVALSWRAEFELGGRTKRIQLHGSDYNGLGLRLPPAWDRAARHSNSENAPYVTAGKRDVVASRWAAVSHQSAQVVLFAPPRGQAGSSRFFSMTDPFTYLSVTQGLDKTPLEYRAGDRFRIEYLVLVHSRERSREQIERRYQQWAGSFK